MAECLSLQKMDEMEQMANSLVYKYMLQRDSELAAIFKRNIIVHKCYETSQTLADLVKASPKYQEIVNEIDKQITAVELTDDSSDEHERSCKRRKFKEAKKRQKLIYQYTDSDDSDTYVNGSPEIYTKTTKKPTKSQKIVPNSVIDNDISVTQKVDPQTPAKIPRKYSKTPRKLRDSSTDCENYVAKNVDPKTPGKVTGKTVKRSRKVPESEIVNDIYVTQKVDPQTPAKVTRKTAKTPKKVRDSSTDSEIYVAKKVDPKTPGKVTGKNVRPSRKVPESDIDSEMYVAPNVDPESPVKVTRKSVRPSRKVPDSDIDNEIYVAPNVDPETPVKVTRKNTKTPKKSRATPAKGLLNKCKTTKTPAKSATSKKCPPSIDENNNEDSDGHLKVRTRAPRQVRATIKKEPISIGNSSLQTICDPIEISENAEEAGHHVDTVKENKKKKVKKNIEF